MSVLHIFICMSLFQISLCSSYKAICNSNERSSLMKYNLDILERKIEINYDIDDIHIDELPASSMELLISNANVVFTAEILPKMWLSSTKVDINFNPKLITIRRNNQIVNGKDSSYCELSTYTDQDVSMELSKEIELAVKDLTKKCIQSHVCEEFNSMVSDDFLEKSINKNVLEKSQNSCINKSIDAVYNPQATINAMADFGVALVINKFILNANKTLSIPDISSQFSVGSSFWKTSGEFVALNGVYEGLGNIKRITDVIFRNEQNRFSVSTSFELANSHLVFDYYKVRFGKININGVLSVLIEAIVLHIAMEFDYNSPICKVHVNNFDVQITNFEVKFTGLGFLNTPASSLVTWIVKKKLYDIVKSNVNDALNSLDCEQFRP